MLKNWPTCAALLVAALAIMPAGPWTTAGAATPPPQSARELLLDDLDNWTVTNREAEIVEYSDRKALRLGEGPGSATACWKDFDFQNGTIELDIAAIPRFTGLVFRVRDAEVYEGVYFRPQNSRHADPAMRALTVQYISHPSRTWYYLRDRFPGRYEAAVDLEPGAWFHVKVVVSGREARVFVNGSATPAVIRCRSNLFAVIRCRSNLFNSTDPTRPRGLPHVSFIHTTGTAPYSCANLRFSPDSNSFNTLGVEGEE